MHVDYRLLYLVVSSILCVLIGRNLAYKVTQLHDICINYLENYRILSSCRESIKAIESQSIKIYHAHERINNHLRNIRKRVYYAWSNDYQQPVIVDMFPVNIDFWETISINDCFLNYSEAIYSVRTSSTLGEDFVPSNLFTQYDGVNGEWITADNQANNSWIILEYPKVTRCNYFRMKARPDHIEQAPVKFELRGSNYSIFEEGKFVTLALYDGQYFNSSIEMEYRFENEEIFMFYQVFIYYSDDDDYVGISEINFGFVFEPTLKDVEPGWEFLSSKPMSVPFQDNENDSKPFDFSLGK